MTSSMGCVLASAYSRDAPYTEHEQTICILVIVDRRYSMWHDQHYLIAYLFNSAESCAKPNCRGNFRIRAHNQKAETLNFIIFCMQMVQTSAFAFLSVWITIVGSDLFERKAPAPTHGRMKT